MLSGSENRTPISYFSILVVWKIDENLEIANRRRINVTCPNSTKIAGKGILSGYYDICEVSATKWLPIRVELELFQRKSVSMRTDLVRNPESGVILIPLSLALSLKEPTSPLESVTNSKALVWMHGSCRAYLKFARCDAPQYSTGLFYVVVFSVSEQLSKQRNDLTMFCYPYEAKDWLYFLPSGSVTTWNDLKRRFLEKYFPASRATTIRKEISGIRQFAGESLFEYWGRFNELVKSCPHHQIPDHLLIQYFYEGLSSMDRKLIDAASGGALFNKTPTEARNLISIMASNTQQFGTRYDDPPRRSNEVSIAAFDEQLNELTSLVKKLAVERTQHVKACGICTSPGHVTDMCPTLQEGPTEHTDAIGGFSGQQQRRYDPFSNTYNPGWKDHPNLSYGAQSQNFQRPQYRPPMPPPSNPKQGTHLEDMMKTLISNTQQIQQNTQQQIQQLQQSVQSVNLIIYRFLPLNQSPVTTKIKDLLILMCAISK
ncbi:UNVERIFIED_CONTAM: hypothetical protein Scaly_1749600 [Sesamum calycinum]|uniref:Retrotransposon gag domain-containing protein n=1 Tax=Sesamum calycinum TaxID=2727403 RepID=A0AAW2NY14_9LAMI